VKFAKELELPTELTSNLPGHLLFASPMPESKCHNFVGASLSPADATTVTNGTVAGHSDQMQGGGSNQSHWKLGKGSDTPDFLKMCPSTGQSTRRGDFVSQITPFKATDHEFFDKLMDDDFEVDNVDDGRGGFEKLLIEVEDDEMRLACAEDNSSMLNSTLSGDN